MAKTQLSLSDEVGILLADVVRRIVDAADPRAIILFGSHAEGRAHPESDLDLLVIADTAAPRLLAARLYGVVADVREGRWKSTPSFDIVVMTPAEWEHQSQLPGQMAFRARRHGVTVHGRAA